MPLRAVFCEWSSHPPSSTRRALADGKQPIGEAPGWEGPLHPLGRGIPHQVRSPLTPKPVPPVVSPAILLKETLQI